VFIVSSKAGVTYKCPSIHELYCQDKYNNKVIHYQIVNMYPSDIFDHILIVMLR